VDVEYWSELRDHLSPHQNFILERCLFESSRRDHAVAESF